MSTLISDAFTANENGPINLQKSESESYAECLKISQNANTFRQSHQGQGRWCGREGGAGRRKGRDIAPGPGIKEEWKSQYQI